jgi:imidazole glycerol-phosphate synthase subunit HisH
MIAIINMGLGNISAFANIYKKSEIPFVVADKVEHLQNTTKIILPGVGSFDNAMTLLDASGMRDRLSEMVLDRRIPVLGICVGMQMLALSSEEGVLPGLGWIRGEVKKFDTTNWTQVTRLPHMGWNNIQPLDNKDLFRELDQDARFYFLHSYYFDCQKEENILALTDYGKPFASAVRAQNIYGVQFHPEKSHQWGIQVLRNFAKL